MPFCLVFVLSLATYLPPPLSFTYTGGGGGGETYPLVRQCVENSPDKGRRGCKRGREDKGERRQRDGRIPTWGFSHIVVVFSRSTGRPSAANNKAGKEKIGIQFCGKLFFPASWENSLRNYSLEKRPNDKRPTTMPVLLFGGVEGKGGLIDCFCRHFG